MTGQREWTIREVQEYIDARRCSVSKTEQIVVWLYDNYIAGKGENMPLPHREDVAFFFGVTASPVSDAVYSLGRMGLLKKVSGPGRPGHRYVVA